MECDLAGARGLDRVCHVAQKKDMRQRACGRVATVVLALWALAGASALACGEEASPPGTGGPVVTPGPSNSDEGERGEENGQTGSLEPSECSSDVECVPQLESFAGRDAEYVLLDSACEHGSSGLIPYREVAPSCVCDVSVTRTARYRGEVSRQTRDELYFLAKDERLERFTALPQCLLGAGAPGGCAYCDHEFPGCNVEASTNDCAEPCAGAVQRLRAEEQVAHDVELRAARCTALGHCQSVVRVDDDCYNQSGVRSSCALGDEEIIAADGERPNPAEQCVLPPLPCATAADCPAGLACDGSVCGACLGPEDSCFVSDLGGCQDGDFVCASAESCISGICVLSERAECVSSADCPTTDPEHDPRVCRLTAVDNDTGRGNEQTRSVCSSLQPNPFGLRLGDVLEARVLGPGDTVASTFEPPLQLPSFACGDSTGLIEGAALRMRVDMISAPSGETDAWPRATLLAADAPIDAVPPPVHPRDAAEGRQLWNALSSAGNAADLVYLGRAEPTELRGCPGVRDMWLRSLLDHPEPGVAPREDGTFPTTLLAYRFSVTDDGNPACAAFPEFSCTQIVQVEVRRLTP
jgi:hypothetical protein